VAERTHALQHSLASLQASQQQLAAQAMRLGELDEAKNQFAAWLRALHLDQPGTSWKPAGVAR
jgi:hypothetical protein